MLRIQGRRWTPEDLSLLRRLASLVPLTTIVATLDRTALAIRTKASHERLPLLDDLKRAEPAPVVTPSARLPHRMTDAAPRLQPEPGDYVVLYEPRTPHGTPRLALVRWTEDPPALIRATFESAESAGPRFEDQARLMASACGARSFRGIDGRYTPLDATVDTHDA